MTEAFSRWQQRQGVEMSKLEKERAARVECERQFQAKVDEVLRLMNVVDDLKFRLARISCTAKRLDKESLMLDCEREQLLKICELANYLELPDSSTEDCGDLGL